MGSRTDALAQVFEDMKRYRESPEGIAEYKAWFESYTARHPDWEKEYEAAFNPQKTTNQSTLELTASNPKASHLALLNDLELLSLARERPDDLLLQALANRLEDLTEEN